MRRSTAATFEGDNVRAENPKTDNDPVSGDGPLRPTDESGGGVVIIQKPA